VTIPVLIAACLHLHIDCNIQSTVLNILKKLIGLQHQIGQICWNRICMKSKPQF